MRQKAKLRSLPTEFDSMKTNRRFTVLDWSESGELSCEVENPANLDARRKEVGLAPFQQDLEKHRQEVETEGDKPPADFVQYKKKAVSGPAMLVGYKGHIPIVKRD